MEAVGATASASTADEIVAAVGAAAVERNNSTEFLGFASASG